MRTYRTVLMVLFSSVSLVVLPLGCGGASEDYVVISRPREEVFEVRRGPPEVPEATHRCKAFGVR